MRHQPTGALGRTRTPGRMRHQQTGPWGEPERLTDLYNTGAEKARSIDGDPIKPFDGK